MSTSWPALDKGSGALKAASANWRNFAVVTTPTPWRMCQALIPVPKAVIFATDLKRATLERMRADIRGADMIVGVGSGLSMDTAKFLAKVESKYLAQVLTTSSNNACFTRTAWTFEDDIRIPERDTPIPRQLVLDYDILMRAPARLNRAGAAEILCSHTALYDWKLAHDAGVDVQWDEDLLASTEEELRRLQDYAPSIAADDRDTFVEIIDVGAKFAAGFTSHPKARFNGGSEHVLAWALEQHSGARLIHGEAVGLSILLMAHIQGNAPMRAARIIKAANMSYRPSDLGITWPVVERVMLGLPEYARRVPWHTIITTFDARGEEGREELMDAFVSAKQFVESLD